MSGGFCLLFEFVKIFAILPAKSTAQLFNVLKAVEKNQSLDFRFLGVCSVSCNDPIAVTQQ